MKRTRDIISLFLLVFLFFGCEKEENIELPKIITKYIKNISQNSAKTGGEINFDGGAEITSKGVCWSVQPNPSIEDDFTNEDAGGDVFHSNLTGLIAGTTYYVRAYATNKRGTSYGNERSFTTFMPDGTSGTVTDIDGNVYKTVHINGIEWMTENLKTTRFNDGTDIPHAVTNEEWVNLETGAYCWYDNNEDKYKELYGALYNGVIVENDNLCPSGWRVASNEEWSSLVKYMRESGYPESDAVPLKATFGWYDEGNGTDLYGFKALPAGTRSGSDGKFEGLGYYTGWYTSTINETAESVDMWIMKNYETNVDSLKVKNWVGSSIRCVRNLNY